jgi:hypothetical protein
VSLYSAGLSGNAHTRIFCSYSFFTGISTEVGSM